MPRSVMQHSFANVPVARVPRSSFRIPSGLKTTFDCDDLIPIYVEEYLPNDTWNMRCTALIRLNSPTLHPLMDNLKATIHWFAVSYRLIWPNWQKMHGAQDDPGDSIAYTTPAVSSATTQDLTQTTGFYPLAIAMGLPYQSSVDLSEISALPFRAYNKIWGDWYRDQNLQNNVVQNTDDGPDTVHATPGSSDYNILKRGKRHDYFTGALPALQKGTAVEIPIAGSAPVYSTLTPGGLGDVIIKDGIASTTEMNLNAAATNLRAGSAVVGTENLLADLTSATGPTLNDFRTAVATQRVLERDQRAGTRYRDHLLSHFGADNDDLRLARAEYLGGGDVNIGINSVPNTSEDAAQKQGELTAYGLGTGNTGFTKTFKEWGIVIGLISVSGDLTYSQGLDKMWTKSTRFDYAYPMLANIGEQAVLDKEIFYLASDSQNDNVWGYQPRYEEHRFKNSRLTGLMHVDHASTLASWHLSEDFASRPALDSTFIESTITTQLDRAIAIPSEPQFNADFYFDLKAARPLPLNGIPGLTRL